MNPHDCPELQALLDKEAFSWVRRDWPALHAAQVAQAEHRETCPVCLGQVSDLWRGLFAGVAK